MKKRTYQSGKTAQFELRCHPDLKTLLDKQVEVFKVKNRSQLVINAVMAYIGELEGSIFPIENIEDIANIENSNYKMINGELCEYSDKKPRKVVFVGNEAWIYKSLIGDE